MSDTAAVCMRIIDQPEPMVPSVEKTCPHCHEPVWASLGLVASIDHKKPDYVCTVCMMASLK